MAVVGRLYVGSLVQQRELGRLRALLNEYETVARTPDDIDRFVEDADGVTPAVD